MRGEFVLPTKTNPRDLPSFSTLRHPDYMPGMLRIIAGIMAGMFFIIAGMPFAIAFAMDGIPLIIAAMLFVVPGIAGFLLAGFSFPSPAGFSFAGCAIVGPASLVGAAGVVGDRLAEFAVCAGVESYLSNSAVHLPLSCGLCARRQPSILALLPILPKQNRMTSSVHAARFSASDGPCGRG